MKNFLTGLLIFFSMCLCGLIAFQWVRETNTRKQLQDVTNKVQEKTEAVLNLQSDVKRGNQEIVRLDGIRISLEQRGKSNDVEIANLTTDLRKATNEVDRLERSVETYKDTLKIANDNILKGNEQIKKDAEDIKNLAEERNEVVKKFNKMATDFNELVNKWNKQQEELMAAATNAAAAAGAKGQQPAKK